MAKVKINRIRKVFNQKENRKIYRSKTKTKKQAKKKRKEKKTGQTENKSQTMDINLTTAETLNGMSKNKIQLRLHCSIELKTKPNFILSQEMHTNIKE